MKSEQNQEFKSSGLLVLMGLLGISILIIITPWNRQIQDTGVQAAMHKAEVVGYQVVQIYREASLSSVPVKEESRLPASISDHQFTENIRTTGTMGLDPWGAAYYYRIISADKLGNVRILVWSSGPNKKVETKNLVDETSSIDSQPIYQGDDLGVLLSMSHR